MKMNIEEKKTELYNATVERIVDCIESEMSDDELLEIVNRYRDNEWMPELHELTEQEFENVFSGIGYYDFACIVRNSNSVDLDDSYFSYDDDVISTTSNILDDIYEEGIAEYVLDNDEDFGIREFETILDEYHEELERLEKMSEMTLNEAIITLITMPRVFSDDASYIVVEESGLEIYKVKDRGYDWRYGVRCNETGKSVFVFKGAVDNEVYLGPYSKFRKFKDDDELKRIDFEAILKTPINNDYRIASYTRRRPSVEKYMKLSIAKKRVDAVSSQIAEMKAKIEEMYKDIQKLSNSLDRSETAVRETRKELGLKERR